MARFLQSMNTVTVSSKYQVVIPKEIREISGLKAGTVMEIINYGSRIELIPIQPMKNLKGIFKGINTEIIRDEDRL
jgi:AbrB family looped-hinge helix DNA binding protein